MKRNKIDDHAGLYLVALSVAGKAIRVSEGRPPAEAQGSEEQGSRAAHRCNSVWKKQLFQRDLIKDYGQKEELLVK